MENHTNVRHSSIEELNKVKENLSLNGWKILKADNLEKLCVGFVAFRWDDVQSVELTEYHTAPMFDDNDSVCTQINHTSIEDFLNEYNQSASDNRIINECARKLLLGFIICSRREWHTLHIDDFHNASNASAKLKFFVSQYYQDSEHKN